jgi:hypothetical protein
MINHQWQQHYENQKIGYVGILFWFRNTRNSNEEYRDVSVSFMTLIIIIMIIIMIIIIPIRILVGY